MHCTSCHMTWNKILPFFFPHWVCYKTCRAALLLKSIPCHHKIAIETLGSQSFLVIWEYRQQQLCHSQRACGYLCTAIELFEISCFPVQKGSRWASRWALVVAKSAQGPWLSITAGQHRTTLHMSPRHPAFLSPVLHSHTYPSNGGKKVMYAQVKWTNMYF